MLCAAAPGCADAAYLIWLLRQETPAAAPHPGLYTRRSGGPASSTLLILPQRCQGTERGVSKAGQGRQPDLEVAVLEGDAIEGHAVGGLLDAAKFQERKVLLLQRLG